MIAGPQHPNPTRVDSRTMRLLFIVLAIRSQDFFCAYDWHEYCVSRKRFETGRQFCRVDEFKLMFVYNFVVTKLLGIRWFKVKT